MAKGYLIRVSVHPYIRKYLLTHYAEPFFVSELGYAPAFLLNALEPMPKVDPKTVKPKDKVIYGDFVGILVGEATMARRGNSISSDNVKRFNQVMADVIHHEMYQLIKLAVARGEQVDDTIRVFQAAYDFTEDELPFDNLKRWYYRERLRRQQLVDDKRTVDPQFVFDFYERAPDAPTPIVNLNQQFLFAV